MGTLKKGPYVATILIPWTIGGLCFQFSVLGASHLVKTESSEVTIEHLNKGAT